LKEPDFAAADTGLLIEKEVRGNALLYHFEGGFSMLNHGVLTKIVQEINAAPQRKIVLDLAAVRFMDSMGVGILVTVLKHARSNGIDYSVVSNDVVDQILGVTRLNKVIRLAHSLEEALATSAP
jgi:anti-sigma B factor antagonist